MTERELRGEDRGPVFGLRRTPEQQARRREACGIGRLRRKQVPIGAVGEDRVHHRPLCACYCVVARLLRFRFASVNEAIESRQHEKRQQCR